MKSLIREAKLIELLETIERQDNKISTLVTYYHEAKDFWWKNVFEDRLYESFFEYYLIHLDLYRISKNNPLIKKETLSDLKKQINKLVEHLDF